MAEKLNTDPWTLLWETPYTQLLQFEHVQLRAGDAWTVAPEKPQAQATAEEIDALLSA